MSHKLKMLFDGDDSLFKDVLKTSKIFGEYGCGSSTEWVLKNTNADIVSVDSSRDWVDKISSGNAAYKKRLKLKYIDLGEVENWGRPVGYEKSYNFINYFNWIWNQDILPDTVLIDGRFRVCCFLTSMNLPYKFSCVTTSMVNTLSASILLPFSPQMIVIVESGLNALEYISSCL